MKSLVIAEYKLCSCSSSLLLILETKMRLHEVLGFYRSEHVCGCDTVWSLELKMEVLRSPETLSHI